MTYPTSTQHASSAHSILSSGELRLWRAVISQAIIDATIKSYAKLEYTRHRNYATAWFLETNHDFKTVCDYAGLDYIEVKNKALKYIRENKKIVY